MPSLGAVKSVNIVTRVDGTPRRKQGTAAEMDDKETSPSPLGTLKANPVGALKLWLYVWTAVAGLLCLGALVTAGMDVLSWLRTAHSTGLTNGRLLADLGMVNQQTGWLGLQKILDVLLGWPAWTGLFAAAVPAGFIAGMVLEEVDRIEREHHAAKWFQQSDEP